MPPYGSEPEGRGKRRDIVFAGVVLVLAFYTTYLAPSTQQGIANILQATVLRPFIATQVRLGDARLRAGQIEDLTAQIDSLSAVLATHGALVDENRTLRELVGLLERAGPHFVPASVLRPGTPGSESMFFVDVGRSDGVAQGAAVVAPHGLVGVIREVRENSAVGMDWTHPDFRVSAMLIDGTTYGIVDAARGVFREDDRLVLRGTAYNADVRPGTVVVTSGLGVVPRGIPVGKIDRILSSEGSWRKSFYIEPMVEPGSAIHVLVVTEGAEGDLAGAWPADSIATREETILRSDASARNPGGA